MKLSAIAVGLILTVACRTPRLERGNAAIAVQFALAVTYPTAGNVGGGGFMP